MYKKLKYFFSENIVVIYYHFNLKNSVVTNMWLCENANIEKLNINNTENYYTKNSIFNRVAV